MPAINRANIAKNLWPGIRFHFGDEYKDEPTSYTRLFDTAPSDKAFEEMQQQYQFGLAPVKTEGKSVAFDEAGNAWTVRVEHHAYALGFIVTREAVADDQYFELVPKYTRALKRTMRITKETRAAAYYDLAFSTTQLGGDGKPLCATDHPLTSGGTLANKLATPADLAESTLEAATIEIMQWTDERELRISMRPKTLHVAPGNNFVADRILGSTMRPGMSTNDINVLNQRNYIPGGFFVNSYLNDQSAWFLRTDCADAMVHFEREALDVEQGDGLDNQVIKVIAYERYSFVHGDPRGVYGSEGA